MDQYEKKQNKAEFADFKFENSDQEIKKNNTTNFLNLKFEDKILNDIYYLFLLKSFHENQIWTKEFSKDEFFDIFMEFLLKNWENVNKKDYSDLAFLDKDKIIFIKYFNFKNFYKDKFEKRLRNTKFELEKNYFDKEIQEKVLSFFNKTEIYLILKNYKFSEKEINIFLNYSTNDFSKNNKKSIKKLENENFIKRLEKSFELIKNRNNNQEINLETNFSIKKIEKIRAFFNFMRKNVVVSEKENFINEQFEKFSNHNEIDYLDEQNNFFNFINKNVKKENKNFEWGEKNE